MPVLSRFQKDHPFATNVGASLVGAALWYGASRALAPLNRVMAMMWPGWPRDLGWLAFFITVALWYVHRNDQQPTTAAPTPATIRILDVSIRAHEGASFPLKAYVHARNNGLVAIAVEVVKYVAKQATLKQFLRTVLQVKIADQWCPPDKSVDQVAVLPGQEFQLWVGLDDTRVSQETARGLVGHLGTLLLRVNGEELPIQL